MEKGSLVGWC